MHHEAGVPAATIQRWLGHSDLTTTLRYLAAVVEVVKQTPNGLGRGVFWWEPMAEGAIAKRGIFDDEHNALPVIQVFDRP